jgi:hypothetical protein
MSSSVKWGYSDPLVDRAVTRRIFVESVLCMRKSCTSWAWWCMPIILALKKLRQEDHEFKASLGDLARPRTIQVLDNPPVFQGYPPMRKYEIQVQEH